jgi:hypothetical protein
MFNSSKNKRHDAPTRCAVCDGPFGLVRHYSWRTPLCSKTCVERLKARRWETTSGYAVFSRLLPKGLP